MDGKKTVQELADAFTALDKSRKQAEGDLIKAANQALGVDVFINADFVRHSQGIDIRLTARIPCDNPEGFWDEG
jgi:hypothetical protein